MAHQLLIGLLAAAIVALVSRRAALLTSAGAVAQFFLGWVFFGLGGWKWAVPVLVFFVSSSLLSRVGRSRKARVEHRYQKAGSRDAWQVLANGGVAGVLALIEFVDPSPLWYIAGLGSLAAANADTWGSEVGVLSRGAPLLVTSLKPTEPGASGGVTLLGSSVAAVGGLLVAASGLPWIDAALRVQALWAVAAAAILGAFLDSVLGALVQANYRCMICGVETERARHCGVDGERIRGLRPVTNDVVNLLCTVAGGLLAAGFWSP